MRANVFSSLSGVEWCSLYSSLLASSHGGGLGRGGGGRREVSGMVKREERIDSIKPLV